MAAFARMADLRADPPALDAHWRLGNRPLAPALRHSFPDTTFASISTLVIATCERVVLTRSLVALSGPERIFRQDPLHPYKVGFDLNTEDRTLF